jgi:ubiquitin-protein ligase
VQLEAAPSDAALAILRAYKEKLQESIKATVPQTRLLELPAELLVVVIQQLLNTGDGACDALAALRSTCTFFTSTGDGEKLLVRACAQLCLPLASEFSGNPAALLEYTGALLLFQEQRLDGDDSALMSGTHTTFRDCRALCESLVQLDVQKARDTLAPLGFVVDDPTRFAKQGRRLDRTTTIDDHYMRVRCSIPGLPGTLHDGALHECNLLFRVQLDDDPEDPALLRNELYPWRPPDAYVRGETYHCMLHGGTAELGKVASCCSRLLGVGYQNWDISFDITEALLHLQYFLHSHALRDPGSEQPYRDAKHNVPLFRKRTRDWALSTQARSRLPEPPDELIDAMLSRWPCRGGDKCSTVNLGGARAYYRIFRHDFNPFTRRDDVVDGQLVAREHLRPLGGDAIVSCKICTSNIRVTPTCSLAQCPVCTAAW